MPVVASSDSYKAVMMLYYSLMLFVETVYNVTVLMKDYIKAVFLFLYLKGSIKIV